jgi:Tfp pilus assembly protein PilF
MCRHKESLDVVETVLSLNPLHYAALSGKGLCHTAINENDKAVAAFQQALAINPFMSQVRNRLLRLQKEAQGSDDGI